MKKKRGTEAHVFKTKFKNVKCKGVEKDTRGGAPPPPLKYSPGVVMLPDDTLKKLKPMIIVKGLHMRTNDCSGIS